MRYVDDWLVELRVLDSPELGQAMNQPSHNLRRRELVPLLYHLFEAGLLVAKTESRGYFTPTLVEIEGR